MIQVTILKSKGAHRGFRMEGHAGYAEEGQDIVCAAASSAAQFVVAGLTEVCHIPCEYWLEEGLIMLSLPPESAAKQEVQSFLETFELYIRQLSLQYKKYMKISVMEVT